MVLRLLFALGLSTGTGALVAGNEGNDLLFEALGRRDCTVVPLWPGGLGPGETKPQMQESFQRTSEGTLVFRPVVRPEMIVIPPPQGARSTGVAVLFCPGGGYGALETASILQSARWLHEMGATAVLLKYRIPRRSATVPAHYLPLMDAQRALGLLRSRAREWNLDPARIGVIGFSAGGHLAAMASNHHATRSYEPVDDHDRVSCRPDFCLLMYPAYLTNPILELKPDPALALESMSPARTPSTFITVVRPDKFAVGCVSYLAALRKAKVPAELHVFSSGGHGGCFDRYPLLGWGYEATRFLKDHDVLDEEAAKAGEAWLKGQESAVKAHLDKLADTAGAAKSAPRADPSATSNAPADALAEADLTAGDAELRKRLGPDAPILPLWPTGTRADDPLASEPDGPETNASLPGPGEILRIGKVVRPTLAWMRPARPDGRAVIVCPGGGYRILAAEHEGVDVGRWLNAQAITALVLKYRVPQRDGVSAAFQDAQRAVSLVRSRAAEFGVDPDWIGVLGFSAGGHLAAQCCHDYQKRSYEPVDIHDKASCRPNFGLLVYAGRFVEADGQLLEPFAHPQRNLTPPMFLAFAADDKLIDGACPYVLALREARVPVAFHIYESGGHGKGLRPDGYPFSRWTFAAERWLTDLVPAASHKSAIPKVR
jgi:acetyl esterase/lipase